MNKATKLLCDVRTFGDAVSVVPGQDAELNYSFIHDSNNQIVTRIDNNNSILYFHYDQVGTIVAVTNSSGGVTNPFQFAGKEYDNETGLYYFGARYYDPSIGRFITVDPILSDTNPYAYAENIRLRTLIRVGSKLYSNVNLVSALLILG